MTRRKKKKKIESKPIYEEYKNKESQEIEDFLNEAREKLNKECGCEVMPYKADVRFIRK